MTLTPEERGERQSKAYGRSAKAKRWKEQQQQHIAWKDLIKSEVLKLQRMGEKVRQELLEWAKR